MLEKVPGVTALWGRPSLEADVEPLIQEGSPDLSFESLPGGRWCSWTDVAKPSHPMWGAHEFSPMRGYISSSGGWSFLGGEGSSP
jgi:hypothetical protein